ncbi:hypothetical protein DKX38_010574 [Salix brachista]|uniref:Uncharacterized protein n=1 Tax=Salix brachista TaxID=2182728 RepID=A0A5N5MG44_9ROSI|nr:hypothetical protein DKX38_010574 [Salix brachista]
MGEEFDEAKAKIEKLKADLKLKTDLADNLRKAHGEQLIRKGTKSICSRVCYSPSRLVFSNGNGTAHGEEMVADEEESGSVVGLRVNGWKVDGCREMDMVAGTKMIWVCWFNFL